ncbi:O-antigen polysaccharide polymerase Wzy [Edwardsiella tarda]|uniref:O-antigen polysaccharide polymerase Wzy n=1 Tax=Edwardsiella tarda TaxID=636 RepID=UPI000D51D0A6|nr:O-antigen polysaccharide polymerase Wzy [Edwardsiella tarda]UCQ26691.1 O-antigen polysaccharide polymerase Wzy [Edwardsiella tarda]
MNIKSTLLNCFLSIVCFFLVFFLFVFYYLNPGLYESALALIYIAIMSSLYCIMKSGFCLWRNSLFIGYVIFVFYSSIYYLLVEDLYGTPFFRLDNRDAFSVVINAFSFITILLLFFYKYFFFQTSNVKKYSSISLFSLLFCFIVELLYLYPFVINFNAIENVSDRSLIEKITSPYTFPYIKQMMSAVLFYCVITIPRSKKKFDSVLSFSLIPITLISLFFLMKLGMRKELLIIAIAALIFYSYKMSDKMVIIFAAVFSIILMILGQFRLGASNDGGAINIINVVGEFFYSHSTLPYIITKPNLTDGAAFPYIGVLLFFIPKVIIGDNNGAFSEVFQKNIDAFDGMGFGFSPLSESYVFAGYYGFVFFTILFMAICLLYKNIYNRKPSIGALLIATLPNFMRTDFKSYFVETLVIIMSFLVISVLARLKITRVIK